MLFVYKRYQTEFWICVRKTETMSAQGDNYGATDLAGKYARPPFRVQDDHPERNTIYQGEADGVFDDTSHSITETLQDKCVPNSHSRLTPG